MTAPGTAFYCMSSNAYFLGAVAMINSLRLQGHAEPIYLLDLGLTAQQRELLAPEVSFVEAPAGVAPWLAKTIAPLRHPAETMVLIDVDMIATRPLGELIERAREGRVVAFENDMDRFVPEWGEILGLGELRRRPYVCSGFVAMARDPGEPLLELMEQCQSRVEFERTFFAGNDPDYPLLYLDQDVLNAILASRVDEERIVRLESRMMSPLGFGAPELVDEGALRCLYDDGVQPYVVHHILPRKPWLKPMYHGVYSRLLMRLLVGPGLAIRVPERQIPVRLREGRMGRLVRARIHARDRLGWMARNHLPEGVFTRLDRLRRSGAATR